MLYSLAVLVIGIYVGQEYQVVPSIKILGSSFFTYMQRVSKERSISDQVVQEEEELGIVGKILKILKK